LLPQIKAALGRLITLDIAQYIIAANFNGLDLNKSFCFVRETEY
jgi:hypothetical protein